jgi:hypothetical protein
MTHEYNMAMDHGLSIPNEVLFKSLSILFLIKDIATAKLILSKGSIIVGHYLDRCKNIALEMN